MRTSRLFSLLLAVAAACAVLSASIAAPILARPFYYAQIEPLGLEEYTGLSRESIIGAYDEMMDFCLGLRGDFSAGVLPWSQSGKEHFEDVRTLFLLDLWMLAVSVAALAVLWVIGRKKRLCAHRFWGRGPGFWAAAGLCALLAVVAALASVDFGRAFTVFHTLFFPGKTNWLFDWRTDPIILILPQVFFRNCALLIGGTLGMLCAGLVAADITGAGKRRVRQPFLTEK